MSAFDIFQEQLICIRIEIDGIFSCSLSCSTFIIRAVDLSLVFFEKEPFFHSKEVFNLLFLRGKIGGRVYPIAVSFAFLVPNRGRFSSHSQNQKYNSDEGTTLQKTPKNFLHLICQAEHE